MNCLSLQVNDKLRQNDIYISLKRLTYLSNKEYGRCVQILNLKIIF